MWDPVDKIKKAVTVKLMKIGINNMAAEVDTPQEESKIVTGIVKRGIPPYIATALAALGAVIVQALQTTDVSLLFTDPKTFGKMLFTAVLIKLSMRMQKPGSTVVVLDNKDAK